MSTHLFVYGSLLFDPVVALVTGRTFQRVEARLSDHRRYRINDPRRRARGPAVIYENGAEVAGSLILDVDEESLALLDAFEREGNEYERVTVALELDDGRQVDAFLYRADERIRERLKGEWAEEEFRRNHLHHYLNVLIPTWLQNRSGNEQCRAARNAAAIIDTENGLRIPICSVHREDGYSIYRSNRFPTFYDGNGIWVDKPEGRSLADWEQVFRRWFDPETYRHTTLWFVPDERHTALVADAAANGYEVDVCLLMAAESVPGSNPLPDDLEIRKVESEEEWDMFYRFAEESLAGDSWDPSTYTGPGALMRKERFVSDVVGIEWFYLTPKHERRILSKLGIFKHGDVCRLQSVETDPRYRRRGYAGMLLDFALDHALNRLGARALFLMADIDYHAAVLYRRHGFIECGSLTTLMKY